MSNTYLSIKTFTWDRDSHGLFDFETRGLARKDFKLSSESYIIRSADSITTVNPEEVTLAEDSKVLALVLSQERSFVLSKPTKALKRATCESMWLVVKNIKPEATLKGYRLSGGDVMKLGRVKFKVVELFGVNSYEDSESTVRSDMLLKGGVGPKHKSAKKTALKVKKSAVTDEEVNCRICLCGETEEDDPLIMPCNCTGTMGNVHLKCLQQWLSGKITERTNHNSVTYTWKNFECELCKVQYPNSLKVGKDTYDLIKMKKPPSSYIILEAVKKDSNSANILHVISLLNKNNIRLGRDHDSDIRIGDVSVSRNHATIKYTKSGLYLQDNNSKFGTLVQVKKPILLDFNTPVVVQTGRTLLNLSVSRSRNFFQCLCSCKSQDESLLEDLNSLN